MLTSEEFRDWCIKLDLNEQTIQEISQIRASPPSRRVQSRRGNVSGRYPSGADLSSEPEKVQLFLSVKNATAVSQLSQSRSSKEKIVTTQEQIKPTAGSQIIWDEINWRVLNLGATEITLLNSQQEAVNLPVAVFEQLIAQKQIIVANTISSNPAPQHSKIRNASESDCAEANRRYRIIAPYLTGSSPRDKSIPKRTFYRWVRNWRQAEQIYGYGYLGLLPQSHLKGNRQSKIPKLTQKLMAEYIVNDYETYKQKSKRAVYGALVNACEKENTAVPSYKTFLKFCHSRPTYEPCIPILKKLTKNFGMQSIIQAVHLSSFCLVLRELVRQHYCAKS